MSDLDLLLYAAREQSWASFGHRITFYLPGMFIFNGMKGLYPAISITGKNCSLLCDHCRGKILSSMIQAQTPELLIERCRTLDSEGAIGVLISGGCNQQGKLPWNKFLNAVEQIKCTTSLHISVHTGFIDKKVAMAMKNAGIDQTLIDVIGDSDTFKKIYHLSDGSRQLQTSLDAICSVDLHLIPHIVCGLDYGKIRGENDALALIAQYPVKKLVIVSLMQIPDTPTFLSPPPAAEEVVKIIIKARTMLPGAEISLGCARRRGNRQLEILAVKAGVNSMALPSDEAIEQAKAFNLDIRYQKTCCSVSRNISTSAWN
jgi:uncharacterized radical SAM superfamily protein